MRPLAFAAVGVVCVAAGLVGSHRAVDQWTVVLGAGGVLLLSLVDHPVIVPPLIVGPVGFLLGSGVIDRYRPAATRRYRLLGGTAVALFGVVLTLVEYPLVVVAGVVFVLGIGSVIAGVAGRANGERRARLKAGTGIALCLCAAVILVLSLLSGLSFGPAPPEPEVATVSQNGDDTYVFENGPRADEQRIYEYDDSLLEQNRHVLDDDALDGVLQSAWVTDEAVVILASDVYVFDHDFERRDRHDLERGDYESIYYDDAADEWHLLRGSTIDVYEDWEYQRTDNLSEGFEPEGSYRSIYYADGTLYTVFSELADEDSRDHPVYVGHPVYLGTHDPDTYELEERTRISHFTETVRVFDGTVYVLERGHNRIDDTARLHTYDTALEAQDVTPVGEGRTWEDEFRIWLDQAV